MLSEALGLRVVLTCFFFFYTFISAASGVTVLRLCLNCLCSSPCRRDGRLRPFGALSWAGVRVSLHSQTERGHGGGHLQQVAGAQVRMTRHRAVQPSSCKLGLVSVSIQAANKLATTVMLCSKAAYWKQLDPSELLSFEDEVGQKAERRAGQEVVLSAPAFSAASSALACPVTSLCEGLWD